MAVHEGDAYGLLLAKAKQRDGWAEVRHAGEVLTLFVITPGGRHSQTFESGGENRAAEQLLAKIR